MEASSQIYREITIFNPNMVDTHKEPLTSTKFWKSFLEMRIEGYDKYIKYFRPRLEQFETLLQRYKEPHERGWVQSIEAELEKEKAQLELLRSCRQTYGQIAADVKEFEKKMKKEEENLVKMKSDIISLQDECQKLEHKHQEEEKSLANKLESLENSILTSSTKLDEKVQLIEKLAAKYDKTQEKFEVKVAALEQKSKQTFEAFKTYEHTKSTKLIKGWKTTVQSLHQKYQQYKKALPLKRCAPICEVDPQSIVQERTKEYQKTLQLEILKKSQQLFQENPTCNEYFHGTDVGTRNNAAEFERSAIKEKRDINGNINTLSCTQGNELKTAVRYFNAEGSSDAECKIKHHDQRNVSQQQEPQQVATENPKQRGQRRKAARRVSVASTATELENTSIFIREVSEETKPRNSRTRPLRRRSMSAMRKDDGRSRPQGRPLPSRSCWDECEPVMPTKKDEDLIDYQTDTCFKTFNTNVVEEKLQTSASFVPYKTTVLLSYEKESCEEMSVKKGETIKILEPAAGGFVLARKKNMLQQTKQGLVPVWTVGKMQ